MNVKKIAVYTLITITVIFLMSRLRSGLVVAFSPDPVEVAQKKYVESIKKDTVGIYNNTSTDKKNDFFVITQKEGSYYIEVYGKEDTISHNEVKITDDQTGLNEMKEASIAAETNRSDNSNNNFPLWFFLLPMR